MYETYSWRQKKLKQTPDVFVYDRLPREFRVQAVVTWADAIKDIFAPGQVPPHVYNQIHKFIATELGVFELDTYTGDSFAAIGNYLTGAATDEALDVLEMMFV